MKLLVLGGAGYVGSHTAMKLLECGYEVVVADNLVTGYKQAVPQNATFYQGDVRDRAFLNKIFKNEKIDAVIHSVHYSVNSDSEKRPFNYYDNDVYSTKIILDAMVDHNIDKIVFSSSASIYGDQMNTLIREEDNQQPTNYYGETKFTMEKMILWAANAYNLKFVFLRYFNVCGSYNDGLMGEYHDSESHLIPLVLQVPNGIKSEVVINGTDYDTPDGTCIRDYIHILDLAQANILAIEYLMNGGESNVFNLGSGVGYSVKEVVDAARRVTGHPIPTTSGPRRKGDPARVVASYEKAKNILGWSPTVTNLDDLIQSAWHWQSSHPNGYKNI